MHLLSMNVGRGGSRALRDGNWRSPTTPDDDPAPGWSNQRQQQPPPSPGGSICCSNVDIRGEVVSRVNSLIRFQCVPVPSLDGVLILQFPLTSNLALLQIAKYVH